MLQDLLDDERQEGLAEGQKIGQANVARRSVLSFLEDIGEVPSGLRDTIVKESDSDKLESWIKLAARAKSPEEFAKLIQR